MRTFTAAVTIDAPAEQVWAVLADVVRWPRWLPTVTAVDALGITPLAVGGRYRIRQPKLRPTVWTVVGIQPPHRFVWQSRAPGLRTVATHTVVAAADGTSRVALEITFSGPLALLAVIIAGRLTDEYLHREAAALKQRVESTVVRRPEPRALQAVS